MKQIVTKKVDMTSAIILFIFLLRDLIFIISS